VTRILIVSESSLLSEALQAILSREPDLAPVLVTAASGLTAAQIWDWRPEVALVDLDGRSGAGLTAVRLLVSALPPCRVVVLAERQTPAVLREALDSQVRGFLSKQTPPAALAELIREVGGGGQVIDPAVALAALAVADNPLTGREAEVLRLAAQGVSTREIARKLFLSEGTVRNRMSAAVRKTGSRNRLEAARRAEECGWL
jgi:two-component system response regulator DesR